MSSSCCVSVIPAFGSTLNRNLVKAYLELYRRYDQPDYQFRLAQLRNAFDREETTTKKGPRFPLPYRGHQAVRWQEEAFGPLLERTMENAQVYHLAQYYDLSRDSRLARAIVRHVNTILDQSEQRLQIRRVRPGELLLRTRRGPLVLPIRTQDDIRRVVAGERWDRVRKDILDRCEARYRELFPEAPEAALERFRRCIWAGYGPRGTKSSPRWGPRGQRPWGRCCGDREPLAELDIQRARQWVDRGPPRLGHLQGTVRKLAHYLGAQAGIPAAIQEALILDLMSIRARFCPRITTLASGQMPVAAMHVKAGRTLWQPTRYQPLAPVVVSVLADGEGHLLRYDPPTSYDGFLELYGRRMARVLTEAYTQDGLLSHAELQWIFLVSLGTVSRAVDNYQRQHHVILPCPGTILDMGRMLTHKDLVVRLHLEGLSVLEIARKTYHHPRSIDAYLKAFDSVLILHLYGLPLSLMASVLGYGQSLVREYLELIRNYLKDRETMRNYLRKRGVKILLPCQLAIADQKAVDMPDTHSRNDDYPFL